MKPKFIALITVLFISITAFSQTDTTKKKADSAYYIADTTTFKIPSRLMTTFKAVIDNADYSHKQYLELKSYFEEQIERQAVKRPKQ